MTRLATIIFAAAAMGFLGVTVLEPIISPVLEKAAIRIIHNWESRQ